MDNLEVMAQVIAEYVPSGFEVFYQRLGLVLGQDHDLIDIGIDAVAQGNVNDTIYASEGNRRFGTITGERIEAFTLSASHDKGDDITHVA
jgi:hypothetical protein